MTTVRGQIAIDLSGFPKYWDTKRMGDPAARVRLALDRAPAGATLILRVGDRKYGELSFPREVDLTVFDLVVEGTDAETVGSWVRGLREHRGEHVPVDRGFETGDAVAEVTRLDARRVFAAATAEVAR